ncbi:YncE family protein [Chishuiella changwenlii]|uniref:YncE family protein n=1 Tax=Chishuiella changwenlii TaxID=1434701 RepID=UPI002FDAD81F
MRNIIQIISCLFLLIFINSCTQDNYIIEEEEEGVTNPENNNVKGFYLLNEGNMGSNSATIDFMDFSLGVYRKNIYATANPTMVKELGDVGNDIKVYGNKLYAVINVSNFIEVMDLETAKHIGTIPLENGRYITFANGKAYASSYAGPVSIDPKAPLGKVVEIDTLSLSVMREVTVGYQPEELEVIGNKLFVANSGGYKAPNYDKTISVVDLSTFKETEKIEVGINLHRLKKDSQGDLYVTSRGDYRDVPSNLYVINSQTYQIKKTFNIPVSNFTIDDDKLYYYSNEFNYNTSQSTKSYGIINTNTEEIINNKLINDAELNNIRTPYGIAVHPNTKDIFLTDVGDYVSMGFVYCFDKNGMFKWKTTTGNIPAHFTFVYK